MQVRFLSWAPLKEDDMKTFKQFVAESLDPDEEEDKAHFMHHAKKMASAHAKMYKAEDSGKNPGSSHHVADEHWTHIAQRHGPELADSVSYGTPNTNEHRLAMWKKHSTTG